MGKMVAQDGSLVDIPDDKMQSAFQSGKFGLAKGQDLPVTSVGSDITGYVSAQDAQQSLATGQNVATRADIESEELAARYGGAAGVAGAGAAGFVRGFGESVALPTDLFVPGIGDMLGSAEVRQDAFGGTRTVTGGEAIKERLRAYQELHPGASGIGDIAGLIAGAVATEGVGIAALGGAVARVAGKGFAGAIARNTVEGALLGGVSSINETALGDEDYTAEKVLAGIGHGALIGGALGGALHVPSAMFDGVKSFFRQGLSSDVNALAKRSFGNAAKGLGDLVAADGGLVQRAQQGYAKAASAASGADIDAVSEFTRLDTNGRAARRMIYDAPKIQDEAARALRTHGDEMLRADKLISMEARGGLKEGYVQKAVRTGNEAESVALARERIASVLDGTDGLLKAEEGVGYVKAVESVSKAAYRTQKIIDAAVESGENVNAKTFIAMDQLKRDMQNLKRNGYRGVNAIADPLDRQLAQKTVAWLDTTSADLRKGLENTDVWGKAAQDQKSINEAWTKQIDASSRFNKSLTTEVGRDPSNLYAQMKGIDPAKAESYVRGLTDPNKDLTHQAVRDYLKSTQDLAEAISTSYDLPADKLAEVATLKAAANAFEANVGKAGDALLKVNQYKSIMGAGNETSGLLTAGGFAFGGLGGGLLGAATSAIMNPGKAISQLAAIERIASKVEEKLGASVSDIFSNKAASKEINSVKALGGEAKTERKTFEDSVARVREFANNPSAMSARLAKIVEPIAQAAPQVATKMVLRATEMTSYLAAQAPAGMLPNPNSLQPHLQPPSYSESEMRSWARSAAAMNDPLSVLQNVKKGTASIEEVEVMKKFYPKIYDNVRAQCMQRVAEMPREMPREMRLQMSVLFDAPTDIDLSVDMGQWLQSLHAIKNDASAVRGQPVKIKVSSYETEGTRSGR